MKKSILIILFLWLVNVNLACTTAVISGKYTKDGRPMIWKLRDSGHFKNKLMFFDDGKYHFIGLVNSEDLDGENVWSGANSEGFAIMNSASFNVNMDDSTSIKDQEGIVMKMALETCATLEDFEEMLKNMTKPMGLAAHFGVIDANGGAAFYEVNNQTFTKFDANDPLTAPNGYIIRTNYSYSGKKDVGYGFIRFQTAQDIFYQAESMGKLNYQTIIQDFSRCFRHSVMKKNFRVEYEKIPAGEHFINSGDLITRHGSSSSMVVRGVKAGEPKDMASIWTNVGFPNTCIAIPTWVRGGKNLPAILTGKGEENAPLNEMALELKNKCYPIKRSSGYKYLQISMLINAEHTGIVQKIEPIEQEIFTVTEQHMKIWMEKTPTFVDIQEFYGWIDEFVKEAYYDQFNIIVK